jgi:GTPase SAR1 family protein
MISLEKANYNFKPVQFSCDEILGEHIKEPFPNRSFFWAIVGRPGSGKTSLLINCLTEKKHNRVYNKVFDKIIYVCPENSRKSIKNNPFDDLPEDQKFESFNEDVVKKINFIRKEFDEEKEEGSNKIEKKKKKNKNQLLILDDVTAYLKDDPRLLIELSTNRRHMKLSIVLLVQFLRSIPKSVRFQITDITLFKPSNELDTKVIEEEYINLSRLDFKELKRAVWKDKHDMLMINKDNDTYYRNLQKITFNNKDNLE